MKCGFREKCQEINAYRKNKSREVLRRSLEYECLVTSLSPCEDFVGLGVLGLLESAPVVTLTLCLASCFSRVAQDLRDHEEIEERRATL